MGMPLPITMQYRAAGLCRCTTSPMVGPAPVCLVLLHESVQPCVVRISLGQKPFRRLSPLQRNPLSLNKLPHLPSLSSNHLTQLAINANQLLNLCPIKLR